MDFADNLKAIRKMRHMTQAQLAEACSVSQQSVQQWEGGRTSPDLRKLDTLRQVLRVSADCLIDGIESSTPEIKSIKEETPKQKPSDTILQELSLQDKQLLAKFHALDEQGQRHVLGLLDMEYQDTVKLEEEGIS